MFAPWERRRGRSRPAADAQVGAVCSIRIGVQDRRPIFADPGVAAALVDVLRRHADQTKVLVHAYCVMPDHVHLLLSPSLTCDVVTFVGQFKNLALRAAWRQGVAGGFWQAGFDDRVLSGGDQLEAVAEQVLTNPVRRGLVRSWPEYPFGGSLVADLVPDSPGVEPSWGFQV